MNIFSIQKYQLYLLQLENYELARFWLLLFRKGYFFPKTPLRKNLVWTIKAGLIFVLSIIIVVLASYFLWRFLPSPLTIIFGFLAFFYLLWPLFLTLSVMIIWPLNYLASFYLIAQAKKRISSNKKLKIIGISGSYGKTTMKNVLETILSGSFKVLATPESVNTPVGIANWILRTFHQELDILIVEMGEHYRGDIKFLCSITPPDVAVLTGVNESHLERLNNLETAVETVFEIVEGAKENSLILLNGDDQTIKTNYERFSKNRKVEFYSAEATQKVFDTRSILWKFSINDVGDFEIPILGEYVIGDIDAAVKLAQDLGMKPRDILRAATNIKPVAHRLQPIFKDEVLIIDDSYNGNPTGVKEAMKVLERFKDRRRLVITPGLVEMGSKTRQIHREIGYEMAAVCDTIILIKNSVTGFIAEGLREKGYDSKKIIWFDTAEEAHKKLNSILRPNDIILFQNDWGDQYI